MTKDKCIMEVVEFGQEVNTAIEFCGKQISSGEIGVVVLVGLLLLIASVATATSN